MYLIFDTETTGLPKDYNISFRDDPDNWPRLVQIAWQLHDASGALINAGNKMVRPDGFNIPYNAEKVHGISTERATKEGFPIDDVIADFNKDLEKAAWVIGHNVEFDINVVGAEIVRYTKDSPLFEKKMVDTKDESTDYCAIPGGKGGRFKWPTLTELHTKLFGEAFEDAHDAAFDVDATSKCFFGLITERVIKPADERDPSSIIYEAPKLSIRNFDKERQNSESAGINLSVSENIELEGVSFTQLHNHTQFSVLQSTTDINSLINTAKSHNMESIAITDQGNMMAAFQFVDAAKSSGIKPILGAELNICKDRKDNTKKDDGFQQVFLAKNKNGYQNLAKLSSIGYIEGFYYVPRIDKEVLLEYKTDIIATTGGLWSEIPYTILNYGEAEAEEAFLWWKEQFGDDFYVELNRHGIEEEEVVNRVLLQFAAKHNVKYFAANNSFYPTQDQAEAHDILLCVKDGETIEKPKKYIGKKGREFRFGFPNDQFYIKSGEEMKTLFKDLPQAIITTNEIVDKVESFELARDVLLPKFDIPEKFQDPKDEHDPKLKNGENNFLRHLTYEGAKKRYGDITDEISQRLDFELDTIRNTGYPGYFLIVQDFCQAARDMDVSVGPGRGSAAGSAVAYCIGITNIDPIKYDLLFERFLNPERVSMPDIDIDFDDRGRDKVIKYVTDKYGENQVAQIITYGTMAAKSSIRDTARALDLPLNEADSLAKLVPDISLKKLFNLADKDLKEKLKNKSEDIERAHELKKISKDSSAQSKVLNQARVLEGSLRNTGIHACGVIITPDDITKFVPVAVSKDKGNGVKSWCTQFDNSVVENAGLLKMDFLGLKTLTLIKDACRNVKLKHGIDLDPENFPLDDSKTYELFKHGQTVGIFQYESPGMQKHLRALKPTEFGDLIAMNALYRPGPLEYIPSFAKRKNGLEEISYDLPAMEEYLAETYGITVYQEQVMLLSQKLAGFTKGEADVLRKAMGKKKKDVLDKMKPKFIDQAAEKGHDKSILDKIWTDWEAFASYAFNKSHSTCYAWVAYQTAYLKAHYPAEFMAAVLSHNQSTTDSVVFFLDECRHMGIKVLGPDVNESGVDFAVNNEGEIRFGLGAIKGTGDSATHAIIEEREKKGAFKDFFDFTERVNLRTVNKKTFESLANAGAFDCFTEFHRRQYVHPGTDGASLIEKAVRYANKLHEEASSNQSSLFGGTESASMAKPKVEAIEPYGKIEKLNIERDMIGLYISGHPLDQYKFEMDQLTNTTLSQVTNLETLKGKEIRIAGIVSSVQHRMSKNGKPFGQFTIEDFTDNHSFFLFSQDYLKHKAMLEPGWFLYITCSVQNRWNSEELELKIHKIDHLSEIRNKMVSGIEIKMNLKDVNATIIDEIERLANENPGNNLLKLSLLSHFEDKRILLDLLSRKFTIDLSDELIQELSVIEELNVKVIHKN